MVNTTGLDRSAVGILARRSLSRRLRALREEAKMTQEAAAREVYMSANSIVRLEEGLTVKISPLTLTALCDTYKAGAQERQVLLSLAQQILEGRRTKSGRWWSEYLDLCTDESNRRIALEQVAGRLTLFGTTLVPALLRVPGYCRAVEQTAHPLDSAADIERRVELAGRRREQLAGSGARVQALLLQCVLEQFVDGPVVMDQQLAYLEVISGLPNVSIRVIPSTAGGHAGLRTGAFTVLEFGSLTATGMPEPPIVYTESEPAAAYLDSDSEIQPYRAAVSNIRRVALDEEHSRTLIDRIAARYRR